MMTGVLTKTAISATKGGAYMFDTSISPYLNVLPLFHLALSYLRVIPV